MEIANKLKQIKEKSSMQINRNKYKQIRMNAFNGTNVYHQYPKPIKFGTRSRDEHLEFLAIIIQETERNVAQLSTHN